MRRIRPIELAWDMEAEPAFTLPTEAFKLDGDTLTFEEVLHALGAFECDCCEHDYERPVGGIIGGEWEVGSFLQRR